MYPLAEGLVFPRDQWWVAAKSSEVGRELLPRTLLEEEVVFYRTRDGDVTALSDRCPHRLFPLSRSHLDGDNVRCGYHGFTFDPLGQCVHMPTQERIPANMKVRSYPVAEHMGWVWIWMGDPALADTAKLPAPEVASAPGWEITLGRDMKVGSRYTLLIDNLFDLTHVAHLHASLIADENGEIAGGFDEPIELIPRGELLSAIRRHRDVPYDAYTGLLFGTGSGQIEFDTISDYHGPALIITGGVHRMTPGSAGEHAVMVDGRPGGSLRNIHAVTPETRHSTHYFSAFARNFRLGDHAFSAMYTEIDFQIRQQDQEALQWIESAAETAELSQEQSGVQDAAAIRVRRLLSQQIAAENTPAR